jgi:CDP-diacylglycerol--glycerol-3-phosphate 3-phosphatidyltransferase
MERFVKFIPNSISISRVGLSVIFVAYVTGQFAHGKDNLINLVMVFLAICITDLLDGRIARKMCCASVTGARLDVLADLFFIVVSNITLISLGILPAWFLVFIIFKFIEFIMTSNFTIKYKYLLNKKVFIFDNVGRIVSALLFIVPGAACIFQVLIPRIHDDLINIILYLILVGGLYSSYIRIKSCFKLKTQGHQSY